MAISKKVAPLKRPYQVLYFLRCGTKLHDSQGHAGSEMGAIRASVVRIFLGQYSLAQVFESGVLIYTVKQVSARNIQIYYGSDKP